WKEARRTAYQALDMFREALRHHNQANAAIPYTTAIRRTLAGDPVDCGRVHTLLAAIDATEGRHADALDHLNTALAIFEQHDRPREIATVCGNIGDVYIRKTDFTLAQAGLQHALRTAERI